MKVGFLHYGRPGDGIRRFGELLASEIGKRPGVSVREETVEWERRSLSRMIGLAGAASRLNDCDLVHIQFNHRIWRVETPRCYAGMADIMAFLGRLRRPLAFTFHDVYGRIDPVGEGVRVAWRALRYPLWYSLAAVFQRAELIITCFEEEAHRVQPHEGQWDVTVVPHFIERRDLRVTRDLAKASLALSGRIVVTLLGFIFPRKGHKLAVEALKDLPADVTLVFAGGPAAGCEGYVESLRASARQLGVEDRLRITGYLPEANLDTYLSATDLAICPFRKMSASSSVATWFSADRPMVCHDLPQLREYARLAPDAIHFFGDYTAESLAECISGVLSRGCEEFDNRALLREYGIDKVVDRHLEAYRKVLNARRPESVWATPQGVIPSPE